MQKSWEGIMRRTLGISPVLVGIGTLIKLTEFNEKILILSLVLAFFLLFFKKFNSLARAFAVYITFVAIGYFSAFLRIYSINIANIESFKGKIAGEITKTESRDGKQKLTLDNLIFHSTSKMSGQVRITTRQKESFEIGDIIEANVSLIAPERPSIPGSFDYKRHAFFQKIFAIGYATSKINVIQKSNKSSILEALRQKISEHFYLNMDKNNAAIAKALFLGDTKQINNKDYEAVRTSGIAHLLAISGMHIALVATLIYFSFTLLLLKIHNTTFRLYSKKIIAFITCIFALAYLLLSGAPISAQRAFIMTSLVLFGIIIDRNTSPIRTIILAANIILLTTPEAILTPSFQMSFSACLSLIYGFNFLNKYRFFQSLEGSNSRKILRYFLAIILSSVFATIATTPFVIYHFKNFQIYSVLTNLVAIPLAEFIIMPFGILGILLIPLGLENLGFFPMETGIAALLFISRKIAELPHASIGVYNFTSEALLSLIAAIIIFTTTKKKLWILSMPLLLFCIYNMSSTTLPDIIIDKQGKLLTVKNIKTGSLELFLGQQQRYKKMIWQQNLGVQIPPKQWRDKHCNKQVCFFQDYNTAVIKSTEQISFAFEEPISLLINLTDNPNIQLRASKTIHIQDLKTHGTHLIWFEKKGIKIISMP